MNYVHTTTPSESQVPLLNVSQSDSIEVPVANFFKHVTIDFCTSIKKYRLFLYEIEILKIQEGRSNEKYNNSL